MKNWINIWNYSIIANQLKIGVPQYMIWSTIMYILYISIKIIGTENIDNSDINKQMYEYIYIYDFKVTYIIYNHFNYIQMYTDTYK